MTLLAWHKKSSMDSACVIRVQEENLYRSSTQPVQELIHDSTSLGELWHKRLDHLHYTSLPSLRTTLIGILVLCIDRDGICRGCGIGKTSKG